MKRRRPSVDSKTSIAVTKAMVRIGALKPGQQVMVERLYPGRHQLARGAWITMILWPDGRDFAGSYFAAKEIAAAKKLVTTRTVNDLEIWVEGEINADIDD